MEHGESMPAGGGMDHAAMGHDMSAGQPHLNDVEFDAYLANDRTLADPEIVRVEAGGRVRLRIINGAAATNFWLDLGVLSGELIAVDGHPVMPVSGRRFPLAIAQRVDVRLRLPPGTGAFPILAVREGDTPRTGIVLATAGAEIVRIPDRAKVPASAVDPALERQLVAAGDPLGPPESRPLRRHLLELTGSMMGFVWGFNGRRFGEAAPLRVRPGERVEVTLVNRTDMSHPVHLHGHPFQVIAIDGAARNGALRDTVLVPIGGSVTIAFNADNPGHWALHCHNLYPMVAGMMTSVKYEA
jgi:FtsP/CotA-like multicopper oxidase with cupredoxin domain